MPGKVQRFYGVNLCFDANFLPHRDAERFVSTLVRCGYNALRIHHHDKFLCPIPSDVSKVDAEMFDRLDCLLAACARLGVYVTTDFYVNRRKDLLHRFKQDLPVDVELQRQHADYIRLFLGHRNPYRNGLRYADDPTLAFAAIVNEGNLGNHGFGVLEKSPLWQRAWGREFPKDEKSNPSLVQAFYRFLADKEVETNSRGDCPPKLRSCLWDLRSHAIDAENFADAVRETVAPHLGGRDVKVDLDIPSASLSEELRHAALHIIREAVFNAIRHERASLVSISGELDGKRLSFAIVDDGRGFDPSVSQGSATGHFGLLGMRERAKAFNGSVNIVSAPGDGTEVAVVLEEQVGYDFGEDNTVKT